VSSGGRVVGTVQLRRDSLCTLQATVELTQRNRQAMLNGSLAMPNMRKEVYNYEYERIFGRVRGYEAGALSERLVGEPSRGEWCRRDEGRSEAANGGV